MHTDQPAIGPHAPGPGADQWQEAAKERQRWYWELMRRAGLVDDDQADDKEGEDR